MRKVSKAVEAVSLASLFGFLAILTFTHFRRFSIPQVTGPTPRNPDTCDYESTCERQTTPPKEKNTLSLPLMNSQPILTADNVSGFIAHLVRASQRYLEVTNSNPVEVMNFLGISTQLLKLRP